MKTEEVSLLVVYHYPTQTPLITAEQDQELLTPKNAPRKLKLSLLPPTRTACVIKLSKTFITSRQVAKEQNNLSSASNASEIQNLSPSLHCCFKIKLLIMLNKKLNVMGLLFSDSKKVQQNKQSGYL